VGAREQGSGGSHDGFWEEIVNDIETLARAGCYERVNKVLSLGLVNRLRRKAARLVYRPGKTMYLADLGAGPGTSTRIIAEVARESVILMVDPSLEMLRIAAKNLRDPRIAKIGGVFESLPFPDDSIDAITAMFSYRDAYDYYEALDEFARVLRRDGRLALLDFYRQENAIMHFLLKAGVYIGVPLALLISRCPRYLNTYKSFVASLDRMLTKKELESALRERFTRVKTYIISPGVAIFYAEGPRQR